MRRLAAAMPILAALTEGARAIVGGAEEPGPAGARAAMILNARGGMCSAVVLAPDVLLTAAHCAAAAQPLRVYYKAADGSPVLVEPAGKAVHPGYDAKAIAARRRSIDLALVRLSEPLPASFAPATLTATAPARDAALTVAGYGRMREGDIRSNGVFRQAALRAVEPYGPSTILVWAEGATPGAGACEGDSGGPIVRGDAVVAVTSWATGPAGKSCGALTQGVLVGPQRGWIDGVMTGWGRMVGWE